MLEYQKRNHQENPFLNDVSSDPAEQQADRIEANTLMGTVPDEEGYVRPKAHIELNDFVRSQIAQIKGTGRGLDPITLNEMNSHFKEDFSDVIIHTDFKANLMCKMMECFSFTYGTDIFFGKDIYQPATPQGQSLLAHELTHVLQQRENAEMVIQTLSEAFVPDWAEFKSKMIPKSPAERKTVMIDYLKTIKVSWNTLDSMGYIELLKEVTEEEADMSTTPPIAGLTGSTPTSYDYMFNINVADPTGNNERKPDENKHTAIAYSLITNEAVISDKVGTLKVYTLDELSLFATSTTIAMKSLRYLDDILKRMLIVLRVAEEGKKAGMDFSIAEIIALYRREGNMIVSPSKAEYDNNIPSGTVAPFFPNDMRKHFAHNVLIFPDHVLDRIAVPYGLDRFDIAIAWYGVLAAGLDQMISEAGKRAHSAGASYRSGFASWSHRNWKNAGVAADSKSDAGKRYDKIKSYFHKTTFTSGGVLNYKLVPTDPVKLTAALLLEAKMLLKTYEDTDSILIESSLPAGFTKTKVDPDIAYLVYQSGKGTFRQLLLSAAINAKKGSNPSFSKLKSSLNDSKTGANGLGTSAALNSTSYKAKWPKLRKWILQSSENWEQILIFIQTASKADWPEWEASRAKFTWMNVLDQYFETTLGEDKLLWKRGLKSFKEDIVKNSTSFFYESGLKSLISFWKNANPDFVDFLPEMTLEGATWRMSLKYKKWEELHAGEYAKMPAPPASSIVETGETLEGLYITKDTIEHYDASDYAPIYFPGMERTLTSSDTITWKSMRLLPFEFEEGNNKKNLVYVPKSKEIERLYADKIRKAFKSNWESSGHDFVHFLEGSYVNHTKVEGEEINMEGLVQKIQIKFGLMRYDGSKWVKEGLNDLIEINFNNADFELYQNKVNLNDESTNDETYEQLGFDSEQADYLVETQKTHGKILTSEKQLAKLIDKTEENKGKFKQVDDEGINHQNVTDRFDKLFEENIIEVNEIKEEE